MSRNTSCWSPWHGLYTMCQYLGMFPKFWLGATLAGVDNFYRIPLTNLTRWICMVNCTSKEMCPPFQDEWPEGNLHRRCRAVLNWSWLRGLQKGNFNVAWLIVLQLFSAVGTRTYDMAWGVILPETTEYFLQCLLEQKLENKIALQRHLQKRTDK